MRMIKRYFSSNSSLKILYRYITWLNYAVSHGQFLYIFLFFLNNSKCDADIGWRRAI